MPDELDPKDVCSRQCGALCCRSPRAQPVITVPEMRRLRDIARERGLHVEIVDPDRWLISEETGRYERVWQLLRADDGACPFLDRDTNLCTIYADRPDVCRRFPWKPIQRCLLDPGGPTDPTL